jgi:hypothetical protein
MNSILSLDRLLLRPGTGALRWLRAFAVLSVVAAALATADKPADFVVRQANVLTVDAKQPKASAFAVFGGKFVAVGSDEAVKDLIGPKTKILELWETWRRHLGGRPHARCSNATENRP